MTEAENVLWRILRNKEIFKTRWKRQHPIDIFVVDFYCHRYRLAIEVMERFISMKKSVNMMTGGNMMLKSLVLRY